MVYASIAISKISLLHQVFASKNIHEYNKILQCILNLPLQQFKISVKTILTSKVYYIVQEYLQDKHVWN